jgi:hypothetical protein
VGFCVCGGGGCVSGEGDGAEWGVCVWAGGVGVRVSEGKGFGESRGVRVCVCVSA